MFTERTKIEVFRSNVIKLKSFLANNETFTWTIIGFGFSNVFRLLSSLILTRIFLPEQFGLMAILISLYVGAELLSDVGIQISIIRHNGDNNRDFLKSAWTLCVIRGFVLCAIFWLSANFFAQLFEVEIFSQILPVFSLIFIIKGFKSTSYYLHVKLKKVKLLTKFELSIHLFSLIITVGLAAYFESLWAFIIAMLITELVSAFSTHYFLKGGVTGFLLARNHISSLIRFGKWLFLSSILTFVTGQGDRFLLGLYLSKENLGIYHVASTLAALPVMLHLSLLTKVVFPSICEKLDAPNNEFSEIFNKLRKKVVLLALPISITFIIFGVEIISLLYNTDYKDAGRMLQILSVGAMFKIIGDSIAPILNAKGDSFRHMLHVVFGALLLIVSILVGDYFFETNGILIGLAISPFLSIIWVSLLTKKYVEVNHSFTITLTCISLFGLYSLSF